MSKLPFNCSMTKLCADVCKQFWGLNLPCCIIDMAQTLALSDETRKKLNRSCDLRYRYDAEMAALKGHVVWWNLQLPGSTEGSKIILTMQDRAAEGWAVIVDEYVSWAVNSQ